MINLIEKLLQYKNRLAVVGSRDYEFDAQLCDHEIKNSNIYRLYYVDYHRIGEGYGMGPDNIGMIDAPFRPFSFPKGISREDGFKVLSYFTDFLENNSRVRPCSLYSVMALDEILATDSFFKIYRSIINTIDLKLFLKHIKNSSYVL